MARKITDGPWRLTLISPLKDGEWVFEVEEVGPEPLKPLTLRIAEPAEAAGHRFHVIPEPVLSGEPIRLATGDVFSAQVHHGFTPGDFDLIQTSIRVLPRLA